MRSKTTLYCSAAIFMQVIPLKTECCLSAASSILFRNSQGKIAESYSVLIFCPLFYQEKRGRRLSLLNGEKIISARWHGLDI